jgi:Ca-activated chloride channel family protein
MKKRNVFTILVLMALLSWNLTGLALADVGQEYNIKTNEIVFLLDTSASMNTQNQDRSAIDAIRQTMYGLPSHYRTGLVAYNTAIQTMIPFGTDQQQTESQLHGITYTGYTNAGEGLSQALRLFTEEEAVNRSIVMLTDGEIDMPDQQAREQSRNRYAQAAARAKEKNIKMFIVAIGSELEDSELHIFDGAEVTDGAIYWEGPSGSLSQIMKKIATERLEFPKQALAEAGSGKFQVEIPGGLSRMKLVITAESGLSQVTADDPGGNGQTVTGQKFAVLDVTNPLPGSFRATFETPDFSGVQAYMLLEYTVAPRIQAEYRIEELPRTEKEVKRNVPPQYQHFADIVIELEDQAGSYGNIWADQLFEGKEISYIIES